MPLKDIEPKDGFDAKTFLYIRTNPADDGTTPLQAGLIGWISPDINITSNPSDTGAAIMNQPNTVQVTISNAGGIQATDALVDCFVADPTTAFTPLNATLIGQHFVTIPSYQTQNVEFTNWIPAMQGHFCLCARVSLIIPSDTYSNNQIFDVYGDRHIAQRNIHIVTMNARVAHFGFTLANPLTVDQEFEFITKIEDANSKEIQKIQSIYKQKFAFSKEINVNTNLYVGSDYKKDKSKEMGFGLLEKMPALKIMKKNNSLTMKKGQVLYAAIEIDRTGISNKSKYSIINIIQREKKSQRIVGGLTIVCL